jgi:hypothetical protein
VNRQPFRSNKFLAVFFSGSFVLLAQGPVSPADPPELVTDRPDVTEASTVVPRASIQVENGADWTQIKPTRSSDGTAFDLTQSLIRIGLADRTEIRIAAPDYFTSPAGFGDLALGFKQQIGPLPGDIDLSVILAVSLPTGASAVSSHGYDPFVKFPWSKELTEAWSIGGMQSVFWYTEDGRRNVTWEPTFYLERQLTKRMDVFAEFAGDYPERGGAREIVHFGSAFKLTPHNIIDMHFGFGLTAAAPKQFIGVGYSFRFDRLWR